MVSSPLRLAAVETFRGLSEDDLARLESKLVPIDVRSGATLVREGDKADTLYVVVAGRFHIEINGSPEPIAEVSAGATIGEIAFFTGGVRTATARAIRDSVVVALSRDDFDDISARAPAILTNITATLASRLAAETRKSASLRGNPRPKPLARTLALVTAGPRPLPGHLIAQLAAACPVQRKLVLTSASAAEFAPCGSLDTLDALHRLNGLEATYDLIVYITDGEPTPWSRKVIRQSDEILLIGYQDDNPVGQPVALNALEHFVLGLERRPALRLVLVHPRRSEAQGTRHWLAGRDVRMHHHVAEGSAEDVGRLWRFMRGEALGLVACGGGAYCAAHIGVYKAFKEAGVGFDMIGGTSGGAAMAAAFAQDLDADEIDARVHRMFITGKAMQRYTLPRYSLLDHTHFDRHLISEYGNTRIEDLWKPYFAVSLDLTDYALVVHRQGPVWAAIRASAAIPALLPPFFTGDGHMLVDGSVAANVPIDVMHQLKNGPNVVVTFDPPAYQSTSVRYDDLPARRELALKMLNPWTRAELPDAPSAGTVLVRSLMANRNHFERHIEERDWLLMPPTPAGMGALDWRRHSTLVADAYRYTLSEIASRGMARP